MRLEIKIVTEIVEHLYSENAICEGSTLQET